MGNNQTISKRPTQRRVFKKPLCTLVELLIGSHRASGHDWGGLVRSRREMIPPESNTAKQLWQWMTKLQPVQLRHAQFHHKIEASTRSLGNDIEKCRGLPRPPFYHWPPLILCLIQSKLLIWTDLSGDNHHIWLMLLKMTAFKNISHSHFDQMLFNKSISLPSSHTFLFLQ